MIRKYSPNLMFFFTFSNQVLDIWAVTWTRTMKELRDLKERFQTEEAFRFIVLNILLYRKRKGQTKFLGKLAERCSVWECLSPQRRLCLDRFG